MEHEDARKAIHTIGAVVARGRALREAREANGEVNPLPEDLPEARDVLDLVGGLCDQIKERREAAAGVEVPPELRQPLAQWHGLVQDEARRRIEEETREQATEG